MTAVFSVRHKQGQQNTLQISATAVLTTNFMYLYHFMVQIMHTKLQQWLHLVLSFYNKSLKPVVIRAFYIQKSSDY
jgi:hypothetical protein